MRHALGKAVVGAAIRKGIDLKQNEATAQLMGKEDMKNLSGANPQAHFNNFKLLLKKGGVSGESTEKEHYRIIGHNM